MDGAVIFLEKDWDDGFLIVCGSFWPGSYDGEPAPDGYPDNWRSNSTTKPADPRDAPAPVEE